MHTVRSFYVCANVGVCVCICVYLCVSVCVSLYMHGMRVLDLYMHTYVCAYVHVYASHKLISETKLDLIGQNYIFNERVID